MSGVASVPVGEEAAGGAIASKLNWLRAGVLGANDGIVSTASLIFGVAGAAASRGEILLAGVAAVAAGALSMAVGEYVSVSSQRDVERAEIEHERRQIEEDPEFERHQLTGLLEGRGISRPLAERVAAELSEKDPLRAHASLELGLDPEQITNPWAAAFASLVAFTIGGLVPLIAVLATVRSAIQVATAAVVVALAITGSISARLSRSHWLPAVGRTVVGGLLAMAITFGIGHIAGTTIR